LYGPGFLYEEGKKYIPEEQQSERPEGEDNMAAVFAKEEAKSKLKAYRLGQRTRNASFVSKIFNKDKPTFKEIKDQVQYNLLRNHSQKF